MPELTMQLLASCKSSHVTRLKDESSEQYLARLTHITLVNQGITTIAHLDRCQKATTLYMYDNRIVSLLGLAAARNLTHVCLQHNRLKRIEGLGGLAHLRKLRLGHNAITVIEGLHRCQQLQELHVEEQRLPPGEKLVFDPRSLRALSDTLNVLNVAGNRMDDMKGLAKLRNLRQLNLTGNFVRSLREVEVLLHANRQLMRLSVSDNPICHLKKWRDDIITMSRSLQVLDDKQINAMTRQFLVNWRQHMRAREISGAGKGKKKKKIVYKPPLGEAVMPKFPSKFSVQNPHWLPPIPSKRREQQLPSHHHGGGQRGYR